MELVEQESKQQKMLISRTNIRNRHYEKLKAKEAEKIVPQLLKVEDMFIQHINQENLEHTYDQIFEHFNAQYLACAKFCMKKFEPKYVLINPIYFSSKYKSKES